MFVCRRIETERLKKVQFDELEASLTEQKRLLDKERREFGKDRILDQEEEAARLIDVERERKEVLKEAEETGTTPRELLERLKATMGSGNGTPKREAPSEDQPGLRAHLIRAQSAREKFEMNLGEPPSTEDLLHAPSVTAEEARLFPPVSEEGEEGLQDTMAKVNHLRGQLFQAILHNFP